MNKKKKKLVIWAVVALLVIALGVSAAVFAATHKKELFLFSLDAHENLTVVYDFREGFSLKMEDGKVAVYAKIEGAKSEKVQKFLGDAIDGPLPYKYYHFGSSSDFDYVIRWDVNGYSLYEFTQYLTDTEKLPSGVNALAAAGADVSEFTWGYLLENIYGVRSADDIKCIVVSPETGRSSGKSVGRYLKIGCRTLSDKKTEELYSLLADVKFDPVSDPVSYGRYQEDLRCEFDFPAKDGETAIDAAKKYAGRKITIVFSDGDVLTGCLYNGSYGTIVLNGSFDTGGMAILPEETAKALNELFKIK